MVSQRPVPLTSNTLVFSFTMIFFVAAIWSSRYCDICNESDSPRTSIVTLRAYLEKYSAACPAEFAPPTMYTSSFL
jgi:hypothetical protein